MRFSSVKSENKFVWLSWMSCRRANQLRSSGLFMWQINVRPVAGQQWFSSVLLYRLSSWIRKRHSWVQHLLICSLPPYSWGIILPLGSAVHLCIYLPQCCDKRLILGTAWGDATLILPLISSALREGFSGVWEVEAGSAKRNWFCWWYLQSAVYKTKTWQ